MTDTVTDSDPVMTKIRDDIAPQIERLARFFTERPDIPAPRSYSMQVQMSSKAELDGLAGDFDQPPPEFYPMPGGGRQAQFAAYMDKSDARPVLLMYVIFYFKEMQ